MSADAAAQPGEGAHLGVAGFAAVGK